MEKDLTVGKPIKKIFYFCLPILLGGLFQQFYQMADIIIVGRALGKEALAAVALTSSLMNFFLVFIMGLTMGVCVVVAQRYGAKNDGDVRKSIAASLIICAFFTVVLTGLACGLAKPLLRLIQTSDELIGMSYEYLIVVYAGLAATMLYNITSTIIRSLGDSKTPFIILVVASALNVGLDILFVVYFKMGVYSAALATVISQLLGGIACLILMLKKYKKYMPQKSDYKQVKTVLVEELKSALPMALQFSALTIGIISVQSVINTYGTDAIAGFAAALRIDMLATVPFSTFGMGMATYSAQNYGIKDLKRINSGVKACGIIFVGFIALSFIIIFCLSDYIILLFFEAGESTAEAIKFGTTSLTITVLFYPFLAILFLFRNTLQGMSRPVIPFIGSILELVIRIAIVFPFSHWFGFIGICFAAPLAWFATGTLLIISFIVIMRKLKREGFKEGILSEQAAITETANAVGVYVPQIEIADTNAIEMNLENNTKQFDILNQ